MERAEGQADAWRFVNRSLNAVGITDARGILIYVNDSTVRLWGCESRDDDGNPAAAVECSNCLMRDGGGLL